MSFQTRPSQKITRVCPYCLKEVKYHRYSWSLIYNMTCPKHGNNLVWGCPDCLKHFTLEDVFEGRCTYCQKVLSSIKSMSARISINFPAELSHWSFLRNRNYLLNSFMRKTYEREWFLNKTVYDHIYDAPLLEASQGSFDETHLHIEDIALLSSQPLININYYLGSHKIPIENHPRNRGQTIRFDFYKQHIEQIKQR
ncbi:TniQ family protein [Paenibacillus tianmuensis]|uniref:TniQ family protein n=1 Tax=Paenibacillus tianmuensis TaxID=624147 RepID=UPI001C25E75F